MSENSSSANNSEVSPMIVEKAREETSQVVVWQVEFRLKFNIVCNCDYGIRTIEMLRNEFQMRLGEHLKLANSANCLCISVCICL